MTYGTDCEIVEDISLKRYFAKNYSRLEGLLYLVYLDGIFGIKTGESLWLFQIRIQ